MEKSFGELKRGVFSRLGAMGNIPEYDSLVNKFKTLYANEIGELKNIDKFADQFFQENNISDKVLQNQILFKAFLCSLTGDGNASEEERKR